MAGLWFAIGRLNAARGITLVHCGKNRFKRWSLGLCTQELRIPGQKEVELKYVSVLFAYFVGQTILLRTVPTAIA